MTTTKCENCMEEINMPNHSSQLRKLSAISFFQRGAWIQISKLERVSFAAKHCYMPKHIIVCGSYLRSCEDSQPVSSEGNIFRLSQNQSRLCRCPLLFSSFLKLVLGLILFRQIATLKCILLMTIQNGTAHINLKGRVSTVAPDLTGTIFRALGQNTLLSQCPLAQVQTWHFLLYILNDHSCRFNIRID